MKWIKIWEDHKDLKWKQISKREIDRHVGSLEQVRVTEEDRQEFLRHFNFSDNELRKFRFKGILTSYLEFEYGKPFYSKVSIEKFQDDWYLLWIDPNQIYWCDEMEGVIDCLVTNFESLRPRLKTADNQT